MKFFGFFAEKYTNGITKTESPKIHNKENIVVSYINVNPSFLIDILGKNETQINKLYSIIKDLFKEKYFYTKLELLQNLSKDSKYSIDAINLALTNIINDSNMIIKDKYNKKGYLINIDDLYIFQPIVLNNKNSSLLQKHIQ